MSASHIFSLPPARPSTLSRSHLPGDLVEHGREVVRLDNLLVAVQTDRFKCRGEERRERERRGCECACVFVSCNPQPASHPILHTNLPSCSIPLASTPVQVEKVPKLVLRLVPLSLGGDNAPLKQLRVLILESVGMCLEV
jgi:hypothetical protein